MPTVREQELVKSWNSVRRKKLISIAELESFLDHVYKLTQNYRDTVESRDKWRSRYYALKKKDQKGGKK